MRKRRWVGCWRGWIRIVGLAAFALAGYLALYTWLRATREIRVVSLQHEDCSCHIIAISPSAQAGRGPSFRDHVSIDRDHIIDEVVWPRAAAVWWPAVRLEIVLDRRGWSPWRGFVAVLR